MSATHPFSRVARLGAVPSLVDMEVIEAIRERSIEVVDTVDGFDRERVRLVGGRWLEPDAVICATGYRRGLEQLVGHLGVLDDRGAPRARTAGPPQTGCGSSGTWPGRR